MQKPGQQEKYWVALGCLLAVAWAAHYLWLTRERDGFTWMDPYQYFGFARAVLVGARPWNSFEVASIYPYFMLPTLWLGGGGVPAGLATHVWVTMALLGVFGWMSRAMEARGSWLLLWIFWLAAPLAFGLAHELYCETVLTLLVTAGLTATWAAWKRGTWAYAALAGGLWGLSVMIKITAPVFYIGPFIVLAYLTLAAGWRSRNAVTFIKIAYSYLIALTIVVILEMTMFDASWDYWRSLGNTTIPVMDLIGPRHFDSWFNAFYYLWVFAKYIMSLGVSIILSVSFLTWLNSRKRRQREPRAFDPSVLAYLAAWILVPIIVFTIQPVKEPRHILPSVPALFMLLAMSVQQFTGRARDLIRGGCIVFGLVVYLMLGKGWSPQGGNVPYFTRGAVRAYETSSLISKELEPSIIGIANAGGDAKVPSQDLWVRYNLDIALAGLPPDESLALTWALRPAIVYDLDNLRESGSTWTHSSDLPRRRYEDLFVYSSFNQYNARCGLNYRYVWMERPSDLRNLHPHALIRPESSPSVSFLDQGMERLPVRSSRIERPDNPNGPLIVDFYEWPGNLPNSRQSYAWAALDNWRSSLQKSGPPLERNEVPTVLASLRRSYVLRQDWDGLRVAAALHPELCTQSLRPRRNLYWYGFYPALETIERAIWSRGPFAPVSAGTAGE